MMTLVYTLQQALDTSIPDTVQPIVNGDGRTAMKHYQVGQIIVKCGQTDYIFRTRANICMDWIVDSDIACVLAKKGGCCGQKRPGIFSYANASAVRRWTNNGGR